MLGVDVLLTFDWACGPGGAIRHGVVEAIRQGVAGANRSDVANMLLCL